MARSPADEDRLAQFESWGEDDVRERLEIGTISNPRVVGLANEWLRRKAQDRFDELERKREIEAAEDRLIASEANQLARENNTTTRTAKTAAIVAATAAIVGAITAAIGAMFMIISYMYPPSSG